MRHLYRPALLTAVLLVPSACSEGTGSSDPLVGVWRLQAIDGAPPPWSEPGWGVPHLVTHSDLAFAGSAERGEGAVVVCVELMDPTGQRPVITNYDRLTYARTGAAVTLRYMDDPTRPGEAATLGEGTLTVQRERENDRPVFTYRKVSSTPRQLTECAG